MQFYAMMCRQRDSVTYSGSFINKVFHKELKGSKNFV
jgi:hypothetical protein